MSLKIIWPNEADSATLTADPPLLDSLPVENLQEQTRRPARSDGLTTPQSILGSWAAARPIEAFALVRHNLSAAASIRLRLYEEPDQAGALLTDETISLGETIPGWGTLGWGTFSWGASIFSDWPVAFNTLWLDESVQAASFQIDISDAANPDGYIEATRLFLGGIFTLDENDSFSYGVDVRWEEESVQFRTAAGSVRTDAQDPYRVWNVPLKFITAAKRTELFRMLRIVGKRVDLFISLYPDQGGELERDHAGQVKITKMPSAPRRTATHWEATLEFTET